LCEENLINQLIASSRCEVYDQYFKEETINVLSYDERLVLAHVYCDECHTQSLLAVLIDKDSRRQTPLDSRNCDLRQHEVEKFKDVIVTVDDRLDMTDFLNCFKGNITQLFGQG